MHRDDKLRTIRLERRNGSSHFGFALRGGHEHKLGFFVTQVMKGSESEQQGLTVGDQVILIDGLPVEAALNREMRDFVSSKTRMTLSVRRGNLPELFECTNEVLVWDQQPKKGQERLSPSEMSVENHLARVTLVSDAKGKFGCSVCEGPAHKKGLYIQSTDEDSVARNAGIKAGDRILYCNGHDVTFMDFDLAIRLLKESVVLNLIISRGAGCDFIPPGESSGYNSAGSSINGDHSPTAKGKKRLSVVREEIIDIIDDRRGIVIGNVTMDYHKSLGDISSSFSETDCTRGDIYDEEKKLHEERVRIQMALEKLSAESEKLAAERKQLEATRKKLYGESAHLHAIQSSDKHVEGETSKSVDNPVHHHQHGQLMKEFKKKIVALKTSVECPTSRQIDVDVNQRESVATIEESRIHVPLKSSVSAPPPIPPPLPVETNHWKRQYSLQRGLPLNKKLDPSIVIQKRISSAEEEAMEEVELRKKKSEVNEPKVRVSIGTFETKPEPCKLDYLPARTSLRSDVVSGSNDISLQLHEELTQTFSRARLRQRIPDSVVAEGEFVAPASGAEVSKAPVRPVSLPARPNTSPMPNSLIIELQSRTREKQEIKDDKEEPKATAAPPPRPTIITIGGSTSASTNNEAAVQGEGKRIPSWPTMSRKPSAQIQAKMASLAAAAASRATPAAAAEAEAAAAAAAAAAAVVSGVSPPAEGVQSHPLLNDSISQSADNKITIQINPYVSNRSLRRN